MLRTGSVVRKEQSFGAAFFENILVSGECKFIEISVKICCTLMTYSPFTMTLTLRPCYNVNVNVRSNYMYFSILKKLFPLAANVRM
jgi:hypothetical protein